MKFGFRDHRLLENPAQVFLWKLLLLQQHSVTSKEDQLLIIARMFHQENFRARPSRGIIKKWELERYLKLYLARRDILESEFEGRVHKNGFIFNLYEKKYVSFYKLAFDESNTKPIAISWASNVDGTKQARPAGAGRPIYCGKKPKLKGTNKAGPV